MIPRATAQGAMWITLIASTAAIGPSAATSGAAAQFIGPSADPSIRRGAARLGRPAAARQAAMLAMCSGQMSEGTQARSGKSAASEAMCWPVPEPIYTTAPLCPASSGRNPSRIGT
jgi:hypothetical protein